MPARLVDADADWSHTSISRPVREYLDALDEADPERKIPKNISLSCLKPARGGDGAAAP